MKSNNGLRLVCIAAVVCAFSFAASSLHAQLANTIWEGTQWISSINMVSLKPDGSANFPSLLGARINLPLEIWFWDNTHFGIVFRNDRWGFDGGRLSGMRKGEYSGHGDEFKNYTYRLKGKAGTFSAREYDDYFGLESYAGRLVLQGNKLTTDRVVYSAPDSRYLDGSARLANSPCKQIGKLPVFDKTVWTKTSRKPSLAKDEPGYIKDP
jgi:hypothetical protein